MSKVSQDIVLRGEHTKPLAQMLNGYKKSPHEKDKDSVLIYYTELPFPGYKSVSYYHTYHYSSLRGNHKCPSKDEVDKLLAMANIMNRNDFLKYVYDLYN